MRIILNNGKSVNRSASMVSNAGDFIFKINTALGNTFNSFNLNFNTTGTINYTVNWGDGASSIVTSSSSTLHSYSTAGIYTITVSNISGLFNTGFYYMPDRPKVIDILQFGTYQNINGNSYMQSCNGLTVLSATDSPDLSICTTVNGFLYDSNNFVSSIVSFDYSNIQSFQYFAGDNNIWNENVSSLDVSTATSLDNMFNGSSAFQGNGCSAWSIVNNTSFLNAFKNTALTNSNYQAMLLAWTGWNGTAATITLQSNVIAHFGYAKYESGGESEEVRNYLTGTLGWTITDGGGI